jgi:hypothetical protein
VIGLEKYETLLYALNRNDCRHRHGLLATATLRKTDVSVWREGGDNDFLIKFRLLFLDKKEILQTQHGILVRLRPTVDYVHPNRPTYPGIKKRI